MPSTQRLLSPLLALALLSSCAGEGCNDGDDPSYDGPTYYQDIAPILSVNCSSCHREGGMNPYIVYDDAEFTSGMSASIAAAIDEGSMPPFFAEESELCPNPWGWQHDPRLSAQEEQLIAEWAAEGGPIGDPATASPVPPPPSGQLEDADVTVYPAGKWTTVPYGEVEDQFMCFSIDPGISEEKWLEALQVVPENLSVVHHVLTGIDLTGATAAMADENGVYDCFGAFGVDAEFVGGWIPGSSPIEFPEYSGLRVPPEARIVLQMHYHMAEEAHEDGTGIALRWADSTPVREATLGLVGNSGQQFGDGTGLQPGPNDPDGVEFFVPAGAQGHTETMMFQPWDYSPRELQVFLVANHMHYVGVDMRLWVERGNGSPTTDEACLLHTPDWDFDWQQFYFYDASNQQAPTVYPGDKLWLQCLFDNSMENPGVVRALEEAGEDAPLDVRLGEGSLDEMCIAVIGQVVDVPMKAEGESHGGTAEVVVEIASLDFAGACNGPASVRIEDDGTLAGVAACGLDVSGQLLTIEYTLSGSVDESDAAAGQLTMAVIGVDETTSSTWTGTLDGDTLQLNFTGSGVFSNVPTTFAGDMTLTATQ
jgi:hypothetical protein